MRKLEENLLRHALTEAEYEEYEKLSRKLAEKSRKIPSLIEAGVLLEDCWRELANAIQPEVLIEEERAAKDRRQKNAAEMPWVHRESPVGMLEAIERLSWLNDRIRTFLHQMAIKHAIVAEGLQMQASAVRSIVEREGNVLGVVLTEFLRRLKRADLKTESVKDLSNEAISALVSALNGKHDVDLLAVLGVKSTRRKLNDEELAEADATQAQLDAELAQLQAELAQLQADLADPVSSAALDEPFVAPIIHDRVETWDYQSGPLPREWWSAAQEAPAPYEWIYRRISPDEEDTILGMELPEAHDWAALRRWDRRFEEISLERIRTARGADNNIRDLLVVKRGCRADDVDENLAKAWVFLLGARVMEQAALVEIFKPRYFEGVVVPCYASGPGVVRELRWIGGE